MVKWFKYKVCIRWLLVWNHEVNWEWWSDKYRCCGYGIEFDAYPNFSINGEWGKNVSLSVHTYNRKNDILVIG